MVKKSLAKKMLLIGALTAGIVGFNSMFNEVQAYAPGQSPVLDSCKDKNGNTYSYGSHCVSGGTNCTANPC